MPCTLGKVRNWDTVSDSVRSHIHRKRERRIHRLLLTQIQMNSDEKVLSLLWNPQILEIEYTVNDSSHEMHHQLVEMTTVGLNTMVVLDTTPLLNRHSSRHCDVMLLEERATNHPFASCATLFMK